MFFLNCTRLVFSNSIGKTFMNASVYAKMVVKKKKPVMLSLLAMEVNDGGEQEFRQYLIRTKLPEDTDGWLQAITKAIGECK